MLPLRLGLRAQIILALSVVFLLSFALLGTATLRLTQAAGESEQQRTAGVAAATAAAMLTQAQGERARVAALEALVARTDVVAVRLRGPGAGAVLTRGPVPARPGVRAQLGDGSPLTLWFVPRAPRAHLPLGNLLLFYVALTGLAVLMLAYFALTHLIVRPLDALTRGSEALAGDQDVRVPERGAAEVARLAAAFNAMAAQLRAERHALEQRLQELETTTGELRTTQQQLIHGEKLASVGRLAAGVAHEIGNPLAAILGLVELLRGGELDADETREFLERIHAETERIHRIIGDLLSFARRHPEAEAPGQTADLAVVVRDAVNLVRPQKASGRTAVELDLPPKLGRVVGPQHRLTQVVLNLLLNALDAVESEARDGHVRISAELLDGEHCALRVDDDGPGIAPEIADHLFEPFSTTKPAGKGTGLGLAVCHALIEAMGGSIHASNRQGGGARFELRLRRAAQAPAPAVTD